MTFEDQLNALVYFHLEEHSSGRDLIHALEENDFARHEISPKGGIQKSSFFEALGTRALEQLLHVYNGLMAEASALLPKDYAHRGDLQAIDGSLIDMTVSMAWAEYRNGSKKAKLPLGFDIHRGVPSRVVLSEGKTDERPFVSQLLESLQTRVMGRYCQCHGAFDGWQSEGKHLSILQKVISRERGHYIKTTKCTSPTTCGSTFSKNGLLAGCSTLHLPRPSQYLHKTEFQPNPVAPDSPVFSDAVCLLGTKGQNQTD